MEQTLRGSIVVVVIIVIVANDDRSLRGPDDLAVVVIIIVVIVVNPATAARFLVLVVRFVVRGLVRLGLAGLIAAGVMAVAMPLRKGC